MILKPFVYRFPSFFVYGFGFDSADGGFAQSFNSRVVALLLAGLSSFGGWLAHAWLVGELAVRGSVDVSFIKIVHALLGERDSRLPI